MTTRLNRFSTWTNNSATMANLLTYNEFKEIVDFQDNSGSEKFNRIESVKEETYLTGLIGGDLVAELKDDKYAELMPLVKKVLSWEILRYYVEIGNVIVNTNGGLIRKSDYSQSVEMIDKKSKINEIVRVLQQYEGRLIETIVAGDYPEYNSNTETTPVDFFKISSIGD